MPRQFKINLEIMKISVFCRAVMFLSLSLIFITAINTMNANSERVSDKIYTILQSKHYCNRRLNATHQMGCSSELGGNLGIVWIVETQDDLDHVMKTGPTPPYISVLDRIHFTRKNLLAFKEHPDRVTGVVFLDIDHGDSKLRTSPFSPEDSCPNRHSGLYVNDTKYDDCKQNSWLKESPVSGLLYDDIPYPIFLINQDKSINEIQSCFKKYNVILEQKPASGALSKKIQSSYPLCGLQLDSFMMAALNSDLCLNSHFYIDELLQSNGRRCDSVDNHNIFAYYKPAYGPPQPTNTTDFMLPAVAHTQSIVMLVSKLSSVSMFSEISPGADSTITSIVTLLAVAEALNRVKNSTVVQASTRNIAFALLDSEPFDYTGSNRMIFNMLNNTFPNGYFRKSKNQTDVMLNTNLKSIEYIINIDQMGNYPNAESIHFHSEPNDPNKDKLDRLYSVMEKVASSENLKLRREDAQLPLPPSPLQEFIRYNRKEKNDREMELTGIVLSNYGEKYNNLFYHSIYDDSHNIDQLSREKLVEHLAQVSNFIARSLFEITFEDSSVEITVDKNLIKEMFQCYLIEANCTLFTMATTAGQQLPDEPIQTYKDPTKRSDDMNGIITAHLLAYFLGDKLTEHNITKCVEDNQKSWIYNYEYINGKGEPIRDGSSGVCIRSQVTMLLSQSPAFSFTQDGELHIDQKYPAWTVSLNSIRNPVRLYLVPSPAYQWGTLILGIVVTIASFIIVYELRGNIAKANSQVVLSQMATST